MPNAPMTVLAASPAGLRVRAVPATTARCLPEDLVASPLYAQSLDATLARIAAGTAFEGVMCPTSDIELVDGEFRLHCQQVPYSRAAALHGPLRQNFASRPLPPLLPATAYLGSATGADTAVLSAEGRLLLVERSQRVGKWPGRWSAAFGEGLEPADLDRKSLSYVSLRCAQEELGLVLDASFLSRVRILMLARDNEYLTWTTYSVLDFRGLDSRIYGAQALIARARGARDHWENSQLLALSVAQAREYLAERPVVPATPYLLEMLAAMA